MVPPQKTVQQTLLHKRSRRQSSLYLSHFLLQEALVQDSFLRGTVGTLSQRIALEEVAKEEQTFLETAVVLETLASGSHLLFLVNFSNRMMSLFKFRQYTFLGVDDRTDVFLSFDVLIEVVLQLSNLIANYSKLTMLPRHLTLQLLSSTPQLYQLSLQLQRPLLQRPHLAHQLPLSLVLDSTFIDCRHQRKQLPEFERTGRRASPSFRPAHELTKRLFLSQQFLLKVGQAVRGVICAYYKGKYFRELIDLHDVGVEVGMDQVPPPQHLNVPAHDLLQGLLTQGRSIWQP